MESRYPTAGWDLTLGRRPQLGTPNASLRRVRVLERPDGPLRLPQFAAGTRTIADAIASTSAATVVAGGETVAAVRRFGLDDRVNHVSAGGTAMLELLAGRELPGVQPLLAQREETQA